MKKSSPNDLTPTQEDCLVEQLDGSSELGTADDDNLSDDDGDNASGTLTNDEVMLSYITLIDKRS